MKQKTPFFLKAFWAILLFCAAGFYAAAAKDGVANNINALKSNGDTTLPSCIQKLNRPASKGLRSSAGARRYKNSILLTNGRRLYAFYAEASIGCFNNDPAGTQYFDDSCRRAAVFPANFKLATGRRPYIAKGYVPDDFPEASAGDYPAFFKNLLLEKAAKPPDPFPRETSFKIVSAKDEIFNFKTGDVLKISTANGLKHFRNGKLLNTYKIIPQVAISYGDNKDLAYFVGSAGYFINIKFNTLLISQTKYEAANTPATAIKIEWKNGYGLSPQ